MGRALSLTLWEESQFYCSMGRALSLTLWGESQFYSSMGRVSLTLWLSRAYMGSKLIVIEANSASFKSLVKHNKQFEQSNCSTNHELGLRILTNQITDQSCAGIEGFNQKSRLTNHMSR